MKRIFLLLAVVGMTAFQSCNSDDTADQIDTDTIAEVYEIRNVNFINDGQGNYSIISELDPQIFNSDMILVYRRSGSFNGNPIWEQIPQTIYFDNGHELNYNFDFTINDINIYLGYSDPSVLTPAFISNQLFRVVIIPGYLSNKGGTSSVDLSDYKAVVKAYGLNESNMKTLQPAK